MASIILASAASSALGSYGAVASSIGYIAGSLAGSYIDNKLFSSSRTTRHGYKLQNLIVQSSAYATPIPEIYGSTRIAGNIIWARPLKESLERRKTKVKSGKMGKKLSNVNIEYYYYATLAIAICKGKIDEITRIWADTIPIDIKKYNFKIYKGSEDQMPDPIIEAHEGIGKVPAYRGLAYVVIENFPLAEFGNRIPNFTFEVVKNSLHSLENKSLDSVENKITAITMIPGSGEFVYDTKPNYKAFIKEVNNKIIRQGKEIPVNLNNLEFKPDALVSLDQLHRNLPNIKWISVTVAWFADSLNISTSTIKPGIEYNDAETFPTNWKVGNFNRKNAHLISKDEEGYIRYGGTPSDESIINYLKELKKRGYKIMLYPLIMVDIEGKPWRGHITGSKDDVYEYFHKENGYNQFILHYANLTKDLVDAFSIGSELKSITKIDGSVKELCNLAKEVKTILGDDITVTYAADWSEYHHNEEGVYILDDLWSSKYIDVIGIDAYFPLTEKGDVLSEEVIESRWESGEDYDYYISDGQKLPLSPEFAIKNIKYWWENYHYNPDGSKTSWEPKMKKIWFTEYGFPSVDNATNQPNVFYDPKSIDGGFPKNSNGTIDFNIQRKAISASINYWKDSEFVENMFLWCWDARPFPYWPNLAHIWRDHNLWKTGHWVNGKLGKIKLSDVIAELLYKIGIGNSDIDVSDLTDTIDGFIISEIASEKYLLSILQSAYFFDIVEANGIIKFISNAYSNTNADLIIKESDIILDDKNGGSKLSIERSDSSLLPYKVDVAYISKQFDYQLSLESYAREYGDKKVKDFISLPLVLDAEKAYKIANISLYKSYANITEFSFYLPPKYIYLEPSDLIVLEIRGKQQKIRIKEANIGANGLIEIKAISDDPEIYKGEFFRSNISYFEPQNLNKDFIIHLFELPAFFGHEDNRIYAAFASISDNFHGASIIDAQNFSELTLINSESTMGHIINKLEISSPYLIDYHQKIEVILINGEIEEKEDFQYALIDKEVIAFKKVKLIDKHHYQISEIIRVFGQDNVYLKSYEEGTRFILLDNNITSFTLPEKGNIELKIALSNEEIVAAKTINYNAEYMSLKNLTPIIDSVYYTKDKAIISWVRNSRFLSNIEDYKDALLGEYSEKYLIEIFIDQELISSIVSEDTQTSIKLTNKKQLVQISQLSEISGKGMSLSITLPKINNKEVQNV